MNKPQESFEWAGFFDFFIFLYLSYDIYTVVFMRTLTPFVLLLFFVGFSCTQAPEPPSEQTETLRLTNESLQKTIDKLLSDAIWTDEQRGRNNEALIRQLKQLASSRKSVDFEDLSTVEAHVSTLKMLQKDKQELGLESVFVRVEAYLGQCQSNPKDVPLLRAEISNMEFILVEFLSSQLGIVDCCFPSPIKVQTNGEVKVGEVYEMVIFPAGDKALWDQSSYTYENIQLIQSDKRLPVEFKASRIGHVMILLFTVANPGAYTLQFTVTEEGDYLAEPWQQDFEWPVVIQ